MPEKKQQQQIESIEGKIWFFQNEKAVTVRGLKLWCHDGLLANINKGFVNGNVVNAQYVTDGEKRQLRSLAKKGEELVNP